ncbi:hypothetical protein D3C80_861980 [compost metagenome]
MLFHSTLGQLHGLGDLAVLAAVDTVEQEDLPGALGQGAQGSVDALQVVIDLHGLFRGLGHGRFIQRQHSFGHAFAAAFAAQVVDGQVAGATQQVGVQRLDLDLGATPEAQEQFLDQVRCRGPAADPAAHQGLHARPLGLEHLDEARPPAAAFGIRLDHVARLAHLVTRRTRPTTAPAPRWRRPGPATGGAGMAGRTPTGSPRP